MRINLSRIYVNDQDKAQRFYTEVLGFVKKQPWQAGKITGVTVASAAEPDGTELLLESNANPAAKRFQKAVFDQGIPATTFAVGNLRKEYERLQKAGVRFTMKPMQAGPTMLATFHDTCGNLIQLHEVTGNAVAGETPIRIDVTSVIVPNQDAALKFYTEVLGFQKKLDIPLGEAKWLTVVSVDEPDGTQLLLEPAGIPGTKEYQGDMFAQGIPLVSFAVKDVEKEYQRLVKKGVVFQATPKKSGAVTTAVFDDTCGNLVQIFQR